MKNNQLFMQCRWENLILLNYTCDPDYLQPYLPPGVELDFYQGKTYISLVAFTFSKLKVMGVPVPFHQHFPELNLRCYVRRKVDGEWRRGVVFIQELVPKLMIRWVAKNLFKERFGYAAIRDRIRKDTLPQNVYYRITEGARHHRISALATDAPVATPEGTLEEFLSQRYYAYNGNEHKTQEYRVEHEPWKMYPDQQVTCDVHPLKLFPKVFAPVWNHAPENAFLLNGSAVNVRFIQQLKNN